MVTVKQAIDDTHAVVVYARGIDGQRADLGFSLHVSCTIGAEADPWAVVSGSGSLVRPFHLIAACD